MVQALRVPSAINLKTALVLTPTTWVRSGWQERFAQATDIQLITELDIFPTQRASNGMMLNGNGEMFDICLVTSL